MASDKNRFWIYDDISLCYMNEFSSDISSKNDKLLLVITIPS